MGLPNEWSVELSEKYDELAGKELPHAKYSRDDVDVALVVSHGGDLSGLGYHVLFRHYELTYINRPISFNTEFEDSRKIAEQYIDLFEEFYDGQEPSEMLKMAARIALVHPRFDLDFSFWP